MQIIKQCGWQKKTQLKMEDETNEFSRIFQKVIKKNRKSRNMKDRFRTPNLPPRNTKKEKLKTIKILERQKSKEKYVSCHS
jgi:hypothetical protein